MKKQRLSYQNIKNIYPLSPMQQGMYFHYLYEPSSQAYFNQYIYRICSPLDISHAENSFNELFKRYEILRTIFNHQKKGVPLQVVLREQVIDFDYQDLRHFPLKQEREAFVEEYKKQDMNKGFDLNNDVLMRAAALQTDEEEYTLIVSFHHILMDGWCVGILISEFLEIYRSFVEQQPYHLPPVKQYNQYIKWLEQQNKESARSYWETVLAGYTEIAALPKPAGYLSGSQNRNIKDKYQPERVSLVMAPEEVRILDRVLAGSEVTLNTLIQAVWGIILGRYNDREDVVFGMVVSGRPSEINGIENIVGLFINTIPVRIIFNGAVPLKDLVQSLQKQTLASLEHQYYPLADIQSQSLLKQNLLDHIFVFENYPLLHTPPGTQRQGSGANSASRPFNLKVSFIESFDFSNYDLNIIITSRTTVAITFLYNSHAYEKKQVEQAARMIPFVLKQIGENDAIKIKDIEIMPEEEKKRLLDAFNGTARDYPAGKTTHQLFQEQVEKTPGYIAIIGPEPGEGSRFIASHLEEQNVQLTYKELTNQSNQLSHILKEKGVQPGTIVGIMVQRSVKMIIGLLGILKAGAAYLPIDPNCPQERINFILKDSNAKFLVKAPSLSEKFQKLSMVNGQWSMVNEKPPYRRRLNNSPQEADNNLQLAQANLAYIIYTSGSTGHPKAVAVGHPSIVNTLSWCKTYYQFNAQDAVLQVPAYTFDSSVEDIFAPLISGSRLVLFQQENRLNFHYLSHLITIHHVTHFLIVPAFYKTFLEEVPGSLVGLRSVTVAGDYFNEELVKEHHQKLPAVKLVNEYGPTENSVCSTVYEFEPGKDQVLIGKPISNVTCYILNRYGGLCPPGAPGELSVSGAGLALGYLNRPELTSEKFDHNLWDLWDYQDKRKKVPGKRTSRKDLLLEGTGGLAPLVYRTGDLARWWWDGNIEFLGRIDEQIKIRGFRIETGEIESHLLQWETISATAVVMKEDANGNKHLCAFIVTAASESLPIAAITAFLSARLPDYMIPTYFIPIDKIPLSPNGKVDRKALPGLATRSKQAYIAPGDELEKKLVEIWARVLGLKAAIGVNDNFFQLGGHSLKATVLAARIHKELNINVPLPEIFQRPTIKELASYIKGASPHRYELIEKAEQKDYYPLSSAQKRLYVLQQLDETSTAYNIPAVVELRGDLDRERLENAFIQLIRRHESLRTSFPRHDLELVQRVHDEIKFKIEYYDLSEDEENYPLQNTNYLQLPDKNETEGHHSSFIIHHSFVRPFDLSQAPLLRVELIKRTHTSYILTIDMHHIIADGVSRDIMVRDLISMYGGESLPSLRIQYRDYSQWQAREKMKSAMKQQEAYWLKEFSGQIPVLNMPHDYQRPVRRSFAGNTIDFAIEARETNALKQLAQEEGATLFMILLALYNVFLTKITGQEDIVVGTVTAGRRHADLEPIIGMFVNTMPLRNVPKPHQSFRDFLRKVKERTLTTFENQDYQFEDLVDKLNAQKEKQVHHTPLFDVLLSLQNRAPASLEKTGKQIPGLTIKPYPYRNNISKFDLMLEAVENTSQLSFIFQYSTKLFKKETIERFINYFKEIVACVGVNPDQLISQTEIISEEAVIKIIQGDKRKKEKGHGKKNRLQIRRKTAVNQTIDCLFIGHNQMDFQDYEKVIRQMGLDSSAYRDLYLNFIHYHNKPYTAAGMFNLLNNSTGARFKPFHLGETFSAAIAYLGSYLHRRGLTFDYINSFREEQTALAAKLQQENILTVAIITTLYISPLPIVEIINFIKKHNRTARIILGGPFVSTQVRVQEKWALDYLFGQTLGADYFINSSQGETTLVKLLRALKNNSPVDRIENLYYKTNYRIHSTKIVKENNRLIENPVDWQLFSSGHGEYFNIRTAISCPFACAFCGFPQHAGDYQTIPVEMIEAELIQLAKMGTVKSIYFIDDTFNVPIKRFKNILRMLVRNRFPFKWHSYLRCQYIDHETVELMKESGCEGVFLGIESGSDLILKNMNKGTQIEKYQQGIHLLKQQEITTFGCFIAGFPGETSHTLAETKTFIQESGLDFYRLQLWYCEPITPIWQHRQKYHIEGESFEWRHATMDAKTACDSIDEMFLSIEHPIWIPQYDFDFVTLWHLRHRGMSLDQIKNFLKAFNNAIKKRLENPGQKEISHRVLKALKNTCLADKEQVFNEVSQKKENLIHKYNAGFDY